MSLTSMKTLILFGAMVLLTNLSTVAQSTWKPGMASITFTVRNAGFNVGGSFSGFAGDFVFDSAETEKTHFTVTVETASINTGNGLRDSHLKKPDYFDATGHPRIMLKSTRITKTGTNAYMATFNLTMKGTTRPIQIPFTFTQNGTSSGVLAGHFSIDRVDYGVGKKNLLLSNDVRIDLKVDVRLSNPVVANR